MPAFQIVWRGVEGQCQGVRLNGQLVLAGSTVVIEIEQHEPYVGERPRSVSIFYELERRFARVLGRRRILLDRLALNPVHYGGAKVAATDSFFIRPPLATKGSSRLVASIDEPQTSAWLSAVSSAGAFQLTNSKPHEYALEGGLKALGGEGNIKLDRRAGSKVTTLQWAVAGVDPLVRVEPLLPGGDDDLRSYMRRYLRELSESEYEERTAWRELFAAASHLLDPQSVNELHVTSEPAVFRIEAGEISEVRVSVTAAVTSSRPSLMALRLVNVETGASTVSDLVRIDRPGHLDVDVTQLASVVHQHSQATVIA